MTLKTMLRYIRADLSRYRVTEKRSYLAIAVMCPGAIAGVYYRLGYWLWNYQGWAAPLMALLRPVYIMFKRVIEIYSGISLSTRAQIGPGLYINHFGSIFVGAVVMGANCNISHEVTLGVAGRGDKKGLPTLGNRVYLGAGAKVIGKIHLGDDVAVGANAVVTHSLPDRAVAVGIPARAVSYDGSFDFVIYDGMENDPHRLASLRHVTRVTSPDEAPVPIP
ncbi:MAG: serine acetyltransferase [Anaerolineae bacterium]